MGLVCVAALWCAAQAAPRGTDRLLDAELELRPDGDRDVVQQVFDLRAGSIVVALVEERGTDISLRIDARFGERLRPAAIEVESRMAGVGVELAALRLERDARVTVTAADPARGKSPGSVRLRVQRSAAATPAPFALAALAWSRATRSEVRAEELQGGGLADLQSAREHFQAAGDPTMAAWADLVRGRLLFDFELDPRAAWQAAGEAERAFQALRPSAPLLVARARFLAAESLLWLSRSGKSDPPAPREARAQAERILRELVADSSPLGVLERARVLLDFAVLAVLRGNLDDAQLHNERALAGFRAADDRAGVLRVASNQAGYVFEKGDYAAAVRAYEAILPEVMERRDGNLQLYVLRGAGAARMRSGDVETAFDHWLRALTLARELGRPATEARLLESLGNAYWLRGDLAQAQTHLARGLEIRATLQDAASPAPTLRLLGAIAREAGEFERALEYHRDALAHSWRPTGRIRSLCELARDHQARSDHGAAIAKAREALAIPIGNFGGGDFTGGSKLVLAEMLLGQSRPPASDLTEARRLLADVLAWLASRPDAPSEITARRLLATVHAYAGDPAAARAEYERAIELIFDYRGDSVIPELRATALANEQQTFRGYVDLLMRRVAARPAGKLVRAGADELVALRLLEFARASNFDVSRLPGVDAAARARRDELFAQLAQKRVRMALLLDREAAPPPASEVDALRVEIAELRAKIDAQHAGRAAPLPRGADGRPFGLRDWAPLPPRTVQLSYVLGARHAYLWVRDSGGVRATRLGGTPAALDASLDALAAVDDQQAPLQLDRQLALLAPQLLPAQVIARNATTVQVSAEGRIASVPFAALRHGDGHPRLFERHAVEMVPSLLGARAAQRRPAAMRLVAVAGGAGPMPRAEQRGHFAPLRATEAEVRSVGALFDSPGPGASGPDAKVKLLTGAEGNASAIRAFWEQGVDILHFATHGLADLRQPLASLLLLPATDPAGNSTYLTAGQVQEWQGSAGLVYLSACESAVGPARFADGMPGLQRAFLRAGADGVIATLRPINDALAQQFATDFYAHLKAGESAAEALRRTQRDWSAPRPDATERLTRATIAWAHQYYRSISSD